MTSAGTTVLAFGGNALVPEGADASFDAQLERADAMAAVVCALVDAGYGVVATHGNGPQVGALALQQEEAADRTPPQPLHALGAMTQGYLGHLLSCAVRLRDPGLAVGVVVTHVVVDAEDPAFERPTKPIGPFFDEAEARRLADERGWRIAEQGDGGFRRVVASPRPRRIVEAEEIRALLDAGSVVIAAGGGGVPLAAGGGTHLAGSRGVLAPVDAVVDKDFSAERLASMLSAEALALVTGVPEVAVDFGTPRQRSLPELSIDEAERHLADGQFPAGSMGPKVEAAVSFLRAGGDVAVITSAEHVLPALGGDHGTRVVHTSARRQEAYG